MRKDTRSSKSRRGTQSGNYIWRPWLEGYMARSHEAFQQIIIIIIINDNNNNNNNNNAGRNGSYFTW